MKLQLLKKREEIYNIFFESTLDFMKSIYDEDNLTLKTFLINDKLNLIYPKDIKRSELNLFIQEYRFNKSLIRKLLQRFYIFVATKKLFEQFFLDAEIEIYVPKDCFNELVFLPGNHSIRVVNIKNDEIYVYIKKGFNKHYLINDAKVRRQNNLESVPNVFDLNENEGWFSEERIEGIPIDKINSPTKRKDALHFAQKDLRELYSSSKKNVVLEDYLKEIILKIENLIEIYLASISKKNMLIIKNFLYLLKDFLLDKFANKFLNIATSHGDFQPGNIICSQDDFWIIDWEYSSMRSIFYDALVYDLKTRAPESLSKRLQKKIDRIESNDNYYEWTGKILNRNNSYYIFIFFAEDLLLKLQEISSDAIYSKNASLNIYLEELQKINLILKNHFND